MSDYTDVTEISEACGRSTTSICKDITAGKLKGYKVGGIWRVKVADALPYIEKNLEEPVSASELLRMVKENETR